MIKGIATIVVRDRDTDKIKRIHQESNDITSAGWDKLNDFYGNNGSWSSRMISYNGGTAGRLSIVSRRYVEVVHNMAYAPSFTMGADSPSGVTASLIPKTATTPWYVEFLNRFDPGASTRTIWGIAVCDDNNVSVVRTLAILATPCVQATTEVLDIYYRIQSLEPTTDQYTYPPLARIDQARVEWTAGLQPTGSQYLSIPKFKGSTPYPFKPAPGNYYNVYTTNHRDLGTWWYNTAATNWGQGQGPTIPASSVTGRYSQIRASDAYGLSSRVGDILSSVMYGQPYVTTSGTYDNNVLRGAFMGSFTPDNWQPVQPIHKHNSSAARPFLDVSTLASGSGSVNATGVNWRQKDYSEFHRVNITATGDVGTSKYATMSRRLTGGFYGNTYLAFPMSPMVGPYSTVDPDVRYTYGHHTTTTDSNGAPSGVWGTSLKTEVVDETHLVCFNDTGIQLFNVRDNVYRNWDNNATMAPALPVSVVRQIAVDNKKHVWVADAISGLFKVYVQEFDVVGVTTGFGGTWQVAGDASNLLNAGDGVRIIMNRGNRNAETTYIVNSVALVGGNTNINVTGNIPSDASATGILQIDKVQHFPTIGGSIDATKCYAVSSGYNGSVWALFDGGLARTDNHGVTWTVYDTTTTPAFNYTGITNGNWANVRFMRVQPDSRSFRMAFVVTPLLTNYSVDIVWWSIAGTAIAGPTLTWPGGTNYNMNAGYSFNPSFPGYFRVSETGGWWLFAGLNINTSHQANTSHANNVTLLWGTTVSLAASRLVPSSTSSAPGMPGWVYDEYGTPYVTAFRGGQGDGYADHPSLLDKDNYTYSPAGLFSITRNNGYDMDRMFAIQNLTKGVSLMRGHGTTDTYSRGWTLSSVTACTDYNNDVAHPLNCQYPLSEGNRVTEELVWDKYHYDSTASTWKRSWHASAVDSSGNGYNGTRRMFNTESHFFTGRSTIQVPASALSTHFTNAVTLAAQVTPQSKLTDQLTDQVLASYIDETNPANNFYLVVTGYGGNAYLRYSSTERWFNSSSVNNANDYIVFNYPGMTTHSFVTGDAVVYNYKAGSLGSYETIGLTNGNVYYVRVVDASTISLHPTTADASANTNKVAIAPSSYNSVHVLYKVVPFGAALTLGTTVDVQLVINGTTVTFYVGGVMSGTVQTLPSSLNLSSTTGRFVIGGRWAHPESEVFVSGNDMFRGTINYVLVDSSVWSITDVTNYHTSPSTFTTPTTRVRYTLTEAFDGVAMASEAKPTHATYDTTINGVQVKFNSGSVNPTTSFVATDYYTFGVVNGILKDNATTFTHNHTPTFTRPIEYISSFTPITVPAAPTTVTEPVIWRHYNEGWNSGPWIGGVNFSNPTYGQLNSFQTTSDDFIQSWYTNAHLATDTRPFYVGVTNVFGQNTGSGPLWSVGFAANGTVVIYQNNAEVVANLTTWDYNDHWEIRRSGGTATLWKNGASIYTWTLTSTSMVYMFVFAQYNGDTMAGTARHTITWTQPAHTVRIGDVNTSTGWYSSKFWNFDAAAPELLTASLNGTPVDSVTVAPLTTTIDNITTPAANSVTFVPDAGMLVFNPADVGKVVSGTFTLLKTRV